jgi:hypothetical protein
VSLERAVYERGFDKCKACDTQRPAAKLTDGKCNDDWHSTEAGKAQLAIAQHK